MEEAIWNDLGQYPATSLLSCILLAWYALCHWKGWTSTATGINACKVYEDGQWWRLATGQLSHHGVVHLAFNVTSLWAIRNLELERGSVDLLRCSLLLVALSGLGTVLFYGCLPRQERERRYGVGFSAVLFGLMVMYTMHSESSRFFGIVYLPMYCAPFVSLIVTQVLVPNSSFSGHLCGIMAGYVVWAGLFSWYSDQLFLLSLPWCFAWVLLCMKQRPSEPFVMDFIAIPSRQATLDDLARCQDYTAPLYRRV
mmetsp:Transcript_14054/g.55362  ORF Transcript_14054/g.55362 Transcript_14054/m.55362 type:complete len:254 (+) Transcript_14054:55-816(+)